MLTTIPVGYVSKNSSLHAGPIIIEPAIPKNKYVAVEKIIVRSIAVVIRESCRVVG